MESLLYLMLEKWKEDTEIARKIYSDLEKLCGKRRAREISEKIRGEINSEIFGKQPLEGFDYGDYLRRVWNIRAYEYIKKELGTYIPYFSEDFYKRLKDGLKED